MGVGAPSTGDMTEFGAVAYHFGKTFTTEPPQAFHGKNNKPETFQEFEKWVLAQNGEGRPTMISDNPAYDWQWINFYFHKYLGHNPFGFSARRIGDFYAGMVRNWFRANEWKRLRGTKHDHNPVHDALGNAEAFHRILKGEVAR